MRNGNLLPTFLPNTSFYVLILPMRNGNIGRSSDFKKFLKSSYPTYEEWKPSSPSDTLVSASEVLILPMRNGNLYMHLVQFFLFLLFLSYLWGMETRDWDLCIKEQWRVLILPMRNGNHCLPIYIFGQAGFLSYLWGMETFFPLCVITFSYSSYPTYEEWKLSSAFASSSMRTWFLSYLWGMETKCQHQHSVLQCHLFLSYLWGMETRIYLQ